MRIKICGEKNKILGWANVHPATAFLRRSDWPRSQRTRDGRAARHMYM